MFYFYKKITSTVLLMSFFCFQCTTDASKPEHADVAIEAGSNLLLKLHKPEECGIQFNSPIVETADNNYINNTYIYVGGGVALADFDLDGLQDVYFTNAYGKGALYKNLGEFKFGDITDKAQLDKTPMWVTAAAIADVNMDGYPDLYLTVGGKEVSDLSINKLYINNKNNTFKEEANERGLGDRSLSNGACFLDYDMDGDLDIYVVNRPASFDAINKIEATLNKETNKYLPNLAPHQPLDTDRFYENDGTGHFKDITAKAGLLNLGYTLTATSTDVNNDGWPDLYVSNDFVQPDRIYINNKNGTFTDIQPTLSGHSAQHSMGTDIADFNNDGLMDVVVLDMLPPNHFRQTTTTYQNSQSRYKSLTDYGYFPAVVRNVLQKNNGNGTYSEIGCFAGIEKTEWSWSSLLADFDQDGFRDLSITNGFRRESSNSDFMNFVLPEFGQKKFASKQEQIDELLKIVPTLKVNNYLYQNKGDLTFENKAGDWMDIRPSWSNGAAYGDLDNDGDLDLVVNNLEDFPFVYENLANTKNDNHYLFVKLKGNAKNPYGYGAKVDIFYQNKTQASEINPTRGIFSAVEPVAHFGLGKTTQIDSLIVWWPDQSASILTNIQANQRLFIEEATAVKIQLPRKRNYPTLFASSASNFGFEFKDVDNKFYDFDAQFTLPWRLSDLTPLMSKADVNGDGLEDVFIGNQFDSESKLFFQQVNGTFTASAQPSISGDKIYEDHGSEFFDADGDGDLDLFVVSGGWDASTPIAWQARLYINDGKGSFLKTGEGVLPKIETVGESVTSFDYDKDGDLDIFIGGRVVPKAWPSTPKSLVLRNDGSKFTDVSASVAGDFENCGMITKMQWADINGDAQKELLVVGEWMPVSVFSLENGKMVNKTVQFGLEKSNGLWNALEIADLNGDGKLDIVSGNFGLNSRYRASEKEPLQCYYADFDKNGSIDPIMAYWENGKNYPLLQRDLLIKQLPAMKKKFLFHEIFGNSTITDIFTKEQLADVQKLEAYGLETVWWENTGSGFVQHIFPNQAQVAPTQAIVVNDFNKDGKLDVFLTGNKFGIEVETNRCDAGVGCLLLGDGKGGFSWLDNRFSGIFTQGDVRDALMVKGKDGIKNLVVSNNDGAAQVFQQR